MIIQTKYRDIPEPECVGPAFKECHQYWSMDRGQPVQIVTPPENPDMGNAFLCKGPFYEVILTEAHRCQYRHLKHYICIHCLEIGD